MQIAFLTQKYDEGERNGLKWDASAVEEEMHNAMENGQYLFEPSQWLSSSQIKSFFTRLTRKRRQQNQTPSLSRGRQVKNQQSTESETDPETDDESLNHAILMQESITVLSQKTNSESSTSSPSTIRKLDTRSIDDLSNRSAKRASTKRN